MKIDFTQENGKNNPNSVNTDCS